MSSNQTWSDHGVTLVSNETGEDICQNVTVRSYGVIECFTKPLILPTTYIAVKLFELNTQSACLNSTQECTYTQLMTASAFPVITELDNSVSNQIIFRGQHFFT